MEFMSPKIPRSERRNCTVISTDTPTSKALRKDIKTHSLEFQLVLNIQHPTEIYVVLLQISLLEVSEKKVLAI